MLIGGVVVTSVVVVTRTMDLNVERDDDRFFMDLTGTIFKQAKR